MPLIVLLQNLANHFANIGGMIVKSKKYLFVCGCPRSGTTALWRFLSGDQRIRIGVERYGNKFFSKHFISPEDFEKSRFFNLQEGDTFYSDLVAFNAYYAEANIGYDDAVYFGDKIPKLYQFFDKLLVNFPESKIIFIVRNIFDVAASYKARALDPEDNWSSGVSEAIEDWNMSLRCAQNYKGDIIIVDYERFFFEKSEVSKIYDFLKLNLTKVVSEDFRNIHTRSQQLEATRTRDLSALEVKEICKKADFGRYRQLLG